VCSLLLLCLICLSRPPPVLAQAAVAAILDRLGALPEILSNNGFVLCVWYVCVRVCVCVCVCVFGVGGIISVNKSLSAHRMCTSRWNVVAARHADLVEILRGCRVDRPDKDVIAYMVKYRPTQLSVSLKMRKAMMIKDLYEAAKLLPHSATSKTISAELIVNGPFAASDTADGSLLLLLRAWRTSSYEALILKLANLHELQMCRVVRGIWTPIPLSH
jgi:hypothetical protein